METRRTARLLSIPIVLAIAVAMAFPLCSCTVQRDGWSFEKEESMPVLCMEVSGGNVVAMVGPGWKAQDGWIQVQLSGGSVPGKEIESVEQDGSTLRVKVADKGQVETMDISLSEWHLQGGDIATVERVVVVENGNEIAAQRAV